MSSLLWVATSLLVSLLPLSSVIIVMIYCRHHHHHSQYDYCNFSVISEGSNLTQGHQVLHIAVEQPLHMAGHSRAEVHQMAHQHQVMLPEQLLKLAEHARRWQNPRALGLDKGPVSQTGGSCCLVLHKSLQQIETKR